MNIRTLSLILLFLGIVSFSFAQTTKKRCALVIGNGAYQNVAKLKNPKNDANAIGMELKKLGFDVMLYTNLGLNDMKIHIQEFGEKLKMDKGIGLFYYAGHGALIKGEDYFIPVDAKIEKEEDVELESVNLKSLIVELEYAQNDLNIVILDANRNNPFAKSSRTAVNQGFASSFTPANTIIAYSTSPGSVALDGSGSNGLYTGELLTALKIPGLTIVEVFKKVRKKVSALSNFQQVPWETFSIQGDFYLNK